ncbi:MAG: DUF721 domain-containing protein [Deltaproteobacteria bacterium]|nr:DUF721 domain-containing protein [Deltaproteobacteria bacterium]
MSRKGAVPLSADIERYLASLGLPQVTLLVALHRTWERIVGPLLSAKAAPARFRNGVLTVAVANHAWAQELQLSKPALLAKIVEATGPKSPVTDLRFVVGPLPSREEDAAGKPDPPDRAARDPEGLSSVADPETRESLRAIGRRLRPKR